MIDLFSNQQQYNDFYWLVAAFREDGAINALRRANDIPLKTYYPIRFNGHGIPIPLWKNYLFIEFRHSITLEICHSTTKLLKVLSMRNKEGVLEPVLVRKNAIDESLDMLVNGKYNERVHKRRFYGRGSMVRVIEGNFSDKRVRLEMDVEPSLPGNKKVTISLGNWNGKIELWKLAL